MKRGEWATQFLQALGNSSPSASTVNFVSAWTIGENTRAAYNPLATTQPMPGSTCFNCPLAHVQNYTSHQQGIEASVKTLENGHYPHILHGLQNNDPEEAALNPVEFGVWGTGIGFVALWKAGDQTQGELLSHTGGSTSGGDWGGEFHPPPRNTPGANQPTPGSVLDNSGLGSGQAAPFIDQQIAKLDPSQLAHSAVLIGAGALLLFIALALAIRTYVPTQQIVKTVASVA